jgi:hypothetical protein
MHHMECHVLDMVRPLRLISLRIVLGLEGVQRDHISLHHILQGQCMLETCASHRQQPQHQHYAFGYVGQEVLQLFLPGI